jgi:glycosyltransferase involved in cell wall biosynthesis
MKLSTVIPVFNEGESLSQLHAELSDVAREQGFDLEILFVDDGSTDSSWEAIERLAREDARVRGIRFRRNFGKAAALSAGFATATGEFVFTLDADLQDDPREMPRFLAEIQQGRDVVSGWKRTRYDPWHKVIGHRPQHLLGTVGLLSFLLGGLGVLALSVGWVVTRLDQVPGNDLHLHQRAIFYYSMGAALLGVQFLSVGLLAEFFAAQISRDVVPYSIKQQIGGDGRR